MSPPPSRSLDWRFLVGAQEGHVGDPDEGPFLAGPEPDDRALLRDLGGGIEVGKANAAQVGGQADEDVPHTVQVGEVERRQQLTEGSVTDPAEEGQGPPEAREEAQLKYTDIVTPPQLRDEQHSARNPQRHQRDVVDGGLDKGQARCNRRQHAHHRLEPAPVVPKDLR